MLTEKQLKARSAGIGGSDVAAICGVSPWRTAFQVWQSKLDLETKSEPTPEMQYGLLVEPTIRQWYSNETGRIVRVPKELLVHPKHAFMVANVDGITDDERVIEIKTSRSSNDWGEPGSDEIPVYYRCQVEHYLIVTGLQACDVPVSFAGSMPVIYEIHEDKELQDIIMEKEHDFWQMVVNQTPPEPVTFSDMIARFKKSSAIEVVATDMIMQHVSLLKKSQDILKGIEKEVEESKAEIMRFLGTADTLVDSQGCAMVTWRSTKPRTTFDTKAFEKEQFELYRQYLKEGEAGRRFLIK